MILKINLLNLECKNSKNYSSINRVYYNENLILKNCYFQRLNTYLGDGGILQCIGVNVKVNIIECNFFNCSSTGYGGAIDYRCDTNDSEF